MPKPANRGGGAREGPGRKVGRAGTGVAEEAPVFGFGGRRGCRMGVGMFPHRIKIQIWAPGVWWGESGLRDHTLTVWNQFPPSLSACGL